MPYLRRLAARTGGNESFLRAALALAVFRERGLIALTDRGDYMTLCLNPTRSKVDLNECPYLVRLQNAANRNRGDKP